MTQPMDDEVRVSQEQILMIEEAKRLYARLGELLTKMCSLNFSTSREPAHSWSLWDTYRQSLGLAATANFVNLYGLDGTIEELKNAITVHEQAQTLFENRDYDTLIGMAHDPAELRMRILVDPRQELSLEELWKLLHWVQVMQSSRINYPHSSEWANMNLVQIDTLRSLPTSVQTAFLFQLGSLVGNASLAAQER